MKCFCEKKKLTTTAVNYFLRKDPTDMFNIAPKHASASLYNSIIGIYLVYSNNRYVFIILSILLYSFSGNCIV